MSGYQYDAFLSYRRRDATRLAQWIRRRLQRFRIWLDTSYEKSNDDFLLKRIFPALDNSERLIVVCTPLALEKISGQGGTYQENWLAREVDHFLGSATAGQASRPIDLVFGPGAIEGRYPGRLSEKARWDWIDLRSFNSWRGLISTESIDDGLTKLVASLYDVPEHFLPVLRREERRQRNRTIVGIAAAACLVVALTSALVFLLFTLRENAIAASEFALRGEAQKTVRSAAEELEKKDPVRALAIALAGVETPNLTSPDRAKIADSISAVANGMANITFGATLTDHADAVVHVSLGVDGTSAITVGADNKAIFWTGGGGLPLRPNESKVFTGEAFAISRYNGLIASSATGGQVQFWSPAKPSSAPKTFEFRESLAALTFDETGHRVGALGAAGKLGVWDIDRNDFLWVAPSAVSDASTIAFGTNCSCLLVGTTTGDLLVWTFDNKDPNVVRGASGRVTWAAFGRDGHLLFGTDDNKVWLTSAPSWPVPVSIAEHDKPVTAGVVSPDGRLAAATSIDGGAWLWDLRNRRPGKQIKPAAGVALTSVTFSPNGDTIAFGQGDGNISIWDVSEANDPSETLVLRGHGGPVLDLHFSADANLIASASVDRTARIWEVHTARRPRRVQAHLGPGFHSVSRSGSYIISGSVSDKKVQIWTGTNWTSGKSISLADNPNALAISDDGKRAFIGTATGEILEWNTETTALTKVASDQGMVGSLEISPDGKWLAALGIRARLLICTLSTPAACDTVQQMSGWGSTVAFSQDGRWLGAASGESGQGRAAVWDLQARTSMELKGHTERVSTIMFDRLGTRAITSSSVDGTARIWDLSSGKELVRFVVPKKAKLAIAGFSADGEWAATHSDEPALRLWKIPKLTGSSPSPVVMETGDSVLVSGNRGLVGIRFGLDGNLLAGSLDNGNINVWHLSDAKLRLVLQGGGSSIQSMHLNERHLTALTGNGRLVSWSIHPAQDFSDETLLSFARSSVPVSGALIGMSKSQSSQPCALSQVESPQPCAFLKAQNIGLPPHNTSGAARARRQLTLPASCDSVQTGKARTLFEGLLAEAEGNAVAARQKFTSLGEGESSADIGLGDLSFLDPVNRADMNNARAHYTRALQSGARRGASRLGWLLLAHGTTEENTQARRYFEESARTNDADGFAGLGWIEERFGQSPQNLERAFVHYIHAQYAYERDGDITFAQTVAERRAMLARLIDPKKVGELFLSSRRSIASSNGITQQCRFSQPYSLSQSLACFRQVPFMLKKVIDGLSFHIF
jgi:WD40 repeat protein